MINEKHDETSDNYSSVADNNEIAKILGFKPKKTGILNSEATHKIKPSQPANLNDVSSQEIEVLPEYTKVIQLIEAKAKLIFVTGRAGTGKSTFIQFLRNKYRGRLAVIAPTGVAALNVGGATIHSFFGFPPHPMRLDEVKETRDNRLFKALEILVIDEISMVRADMFDNIARFLQLNGRSPGCLFGGVQIILVGDLFQLPPIASTEEESTLFKRKFESKFFFSAKSIGEVETVPVELKRVFRQTDQKFIELLNRVRLGDNSQSILDLLNSRFGKALPDLPPITLTPTNAIADQINQDGLKSLPGEERMFRGIFGGEFNEKKRLPAPMELRLKEGARVMFTKNGGTNWVNGSLGVVRDFQWIKRLNMSTMMEEDKEAVFVELNERGRGIVAVVTETWERYKYFYDSQNDEIEVKTVGYYSQYPLQPAWAVTIHKSQGQTLSEVQIDLTTGAFEAGQTYVALSRARSLDKIWLNSTIKARDIICDFQILKFYKSLFPNDFEIPAENLTKDDITGQLEKQEDNIGNQIQLVARDYPDYLSIAKIVNSALETDDHLLLVYIDSMNEKTERVVKPIAWINSQMFNAFCDLRQAERHFKLSRIVECHVF